MTAIEHLIERHHLNAELLKMNKAFLLAVKQRKECLELEIVLSQIQELHNHLSAVKILISR